MKLLDNHESKEIWFSQLVKPYNLSDSFDGEPFVCIIFNNDKIISSGDQQLISEKLVSLNCRYAVCAGCDCSSWDDSIDFAYISTDENYDPPEDTLVMTTWHEDESVSEVMFFGLNCTHFDDHDFKKYLVLFVGQRDGLLDQVKKAIKSEWVELNKC